MAVALAKVSGADYTHGNKKVKVRDLTFSGNYATGGESLTASSFGLRVLEQVIFHGHAAAADEATANMLHYDYTGKKVVFYEGSTAGTALSEKTNAEAYPTGCKVRVTAIGR